MFYDDLCCAKTGNTCVASGTPHCCPNSFCQVPDGGTEGVCTVQCKIAGLGCRTDAGAPCCVGTFCGPSDTCQSCLNTGQSCDGTNPCCAGTNCVLGTCQACRGQAQACNNSYGGGLLREQRSRMLARDCARHVLYQGESALQRRLGVLLPLERLQPPAKWRPQSVPKGRPMIGSKRFPSALLVAAFLGVAAGNCARAPGDPSVATQGGSAVAQNPPEQPLDARTRGWDLGRLYAYRLKLTSTVSMGGPDNTFDFDLTGVVRIATMTVTPEVATLYATMVDVKTVSRMPDSQSEFDKLAALIQKAGCFFTFSGGRLSELRVPQGAAPTVVNVYRQVVSALQFARPARESVHYTADEYDTTGKYVADYTLDPTTHLWQKRKQKYVSLLTPTLQQGNIPVQIVPEVIVSKGAIELLADGRPGLIEMRDDISIRAAELPLRSSNVLSLETGPSEPAPLVAPNWTALLAATSRLASDEPYVVAGMDQSLEDQRAGGLTFEQAVEGLEQLAKGNAESGNGADQPALARESKLFTALSSILRTQPKKIPLAIQKIRAKAPVSRTLIDALASASSPEAQAALVKLMNSKTTEAEVRNDVAASLSRTPNPDAVSIAAFKALLAADPWSTQALYALGTYSRRLRDAGKPDQAKELGELLASRLALAPSAGTLADVLRAIANSGYAGALAKVVPHLKSQEEEVRAAAVRALQSMQNPKVDELIAACLETDPSRQVRLAAIEAAKLRQPSDSLARAVTSAATNAESDAHVRYAAVQLMIRWLPKGRTELRATLEKVSHDDQEQRIRELATTAL